MRRLKVSEIVSVIAVILVLMVLAALMMPAVQQARESGRVASQAPNRAAEFAQPRVAFAESGLKSERASTDASINVGKEITSPGLDRKIISSASIELVVEDFSDVSNKLAATVKKFDGYIADSSLSGSSGDSRRGMWKIRVPATQFDDFVTAAKQLGDLVNANTTSKDISEEYYDVDARIRNKTKEEERMLKLLEDRPGKLEDVIAIEHELSRVREELEQMQGRMRVLTDLTALTTTEITISEIHNYQPEAAPTLGMRINRAFGGSYNALIATGGNLLVVGASLTPWLPVIAVGITMLFFLGRLSIKYDRKL